MIRQLMDYISGVAGTRIVTVRDKIYIIDEGFNEWNDLSNDISFVLNHFGSIIIRQDTPMRRSCGSVYQKICGFLATHGELYSVPADDLKEIYEDIQPYEIFHEVKFESKS